MTKLYSDKLKLAMAEIKEVLTRHDIAGHVVLYDEHLSEYLLHVGPTWSVLRIEDGGLRFRSQIAEFGGDADARRKATELTTGMLRHFADLLMRDWMHFEKMLQSLAEHFVIEHSDPSHTPHREH